MGAQVTGVCSSSKAELVRSIGADDVIDYTREDFIDRKRQFDLIIDTAGRRPLSRLRRALAADGLLVIVGGEGGGRWLGGFQRQLGRTLALDRERQKLIGLMYRETQDLLLALTELIEDGKLTPVIDRTYPLSEAAEAIRDLEQGPAAGKLVPDDALRRTGRRIFPRPPSRLAASIRLHCCVYSCLTGVPT